MRAVLLIVVSAVACGSGRDSVPGGGGGRAATTGGAGGAGAAQTFPVTVATGPLYDAGTHCPAKALASSADSQHVCMLDTCGQVYCWGRNDAGQTGEPLGGGLPQTTLPYRVKGVQNAIAIAVGDGHSLALREDHVVLGWGDAEDGELGAFAGGSIPARVRELDGATAVFASVAGTLGIVEGRWVFLGNVGIPAISAGLKAFGNIVGYGAVADVQGRGGCVLNDLGSVFCWGDNQDGELGDGTTMTRPDPVKAQLSASAVDFSLSNLFACAALQSGAVQCWGDFVGAHLGSSYCPGNMDVVSTPQTLGGLSDVVKVTAAGGLCALDREGQVACLGSIFDGSAGCSPRAIALDDVADVVAGGENVWMVTRKGRVYSVGGNMYGELGIGDPSPNGSWTPSEVTWE